MRVILIGVKNALFEMMFKSKLDLQKGIIQAKIGVKNVSVQETVNAKPLRQKRLGVFKEQNRRILWLEQSELRGDIRNEVAKVVRDQTMLRKCGVEES